MTRSDTLHVLQLTDLHLQDNPAATMQGRNVRGSLNAVIESSKLHPHWPPELIAVTGDIVHDESPGGYQRVYRWLASELGGITNLCCIPGNHDDSIILNDTLKDLPVQTRGYLELGNWQLILLDSTVPGCAGGELDDEQLETIEYALKHRTVDNSLILIHHPITDIGSRWMDSMKVTNGSAFFALISDYQNIAAVISGHAHQVFDITQQNIRLLGAPATCPTQFKPGSKDYAEDSVAPGARWLSLLPDGNLETQIIRAN